MISNWTNEDIEAVLRQLDERSLPFGKYRFSSLDGGLRLLGRGSTANVYKAETRDKHKKGYAIKVIGFGDRYVESEAFRKSVGIQKELGQYQNNIVRIYDSAEVLVWIEGDHTVTKAEPAGPGGDADSPGDCLRLQFILMEELVTVIKESRFGKPSLIQPLSTGDETEILKLTYDIGTALRQAHENKLIHRDVKLENIFYTPAGGGRYKLGDFGIARTTDNGMASTVAFTRGYGAPEVVGTLEDKYDCTADIYSFGMVLYVILNELRFPESSNYHPNPRQYMYGFAPSDPLHGSDELCRMVLRMLAFDPDDRYQSMDEVLNGLDQLRYGRRLQFQREHKPASLAVGTAFALTGAALWKLSFAPELEIRMTGLMYLFWSFCVIKGLLGIYRKHSYIISAAVFGLGAWLLIGTGFSMPKLVFFLLLSLSEGVLAGAAGGSVLVIRAADLIMGVSPGYFGDYSSLRWAAVLLVSLSCVLLFQYSILGEHDPRITKEYFKRNAYWIIVCGLYAVIALSAPVVTGPEPANIFLRLLRLLTGERVYSAVFETNPAMIGIFGLLFCLIWTGRETIMMLLEPRLAKVRAAVEEER